MFWERQRYVSNIIDFRESGSSRQAFVPALFTRLHRVHPKDNRRNLKQL